MKTDIFLFLRRGVCLLIAFFFIVNSTVSYAQVAGQMPWMPEPGTMVNLTPAFMPAQLKGMVIHPNEPFKFDFIINKGDEPLSDTQQQDEYKKLIKYFLASLAVPDKDQWVNLSPYEKDRIIADDFGKTEMGRDLLAQDYLLKQIVSSLSHPEGDLGKQFWARVYEEAQKKYGTTDVPAETVNKVWITPDHATIYETKDAVVVIDYHLKVMLESDYFAMQKMQEERSGSAEDMPPADALSELQDMSKNIMREVIIPALEKEVNEGKNFAPLRQTYSGMILAAWYKRALKESVLNQVYGDKNKVKGVEQADTAKNKEIWEEYVSAFRKGAFNMIKEDVDELSGEIIPRKYFSGGADSAEELFENPGAVIPGSKSQAGAVVVGADVVSGKYADPGARGSVQPAAALTTIESPTTYHDVFGGVSSEGKEELRNIILKLESYANDPSKKNSTTPVLGGEITIEIMKDPDYVMEVFLHLLCLPHKPSNYRSMIYQGISNAVRYMNRLREGESWDVPRAILNELEEGNRSGSYKISKEVFDHVGLFGKNNEDFIRRLKWDLFPDALISRKPIIPLNLAPDRILKFGRELEEIDFGAKPDQWQYLNPEGTLSSERTDMISRIGNYGEIYQLATRLVAGKNRGAFETRTGNLEKSSVSTVDVQDWLSLHPDSEYAALLQKTLTDYRQLEKSIRALVKDMDGLSPSLVVGLQNEQPLQSPGQDVLNAAQQQVLWLRSSLKLIEGIINETRPDRYDEEAGGLSLHLRFEYSLNNHKLVQRNREKIFDEWRKAHHVTGPRMDDPDPQIIEMRVKHALVGPTTNTLGKTTGQVIVEKLKYHVDHPSHDELPAYLYGFRSGVILEVNAKVRQSYRKDVGSRLNPFTGLLSTTYGVKPIDPRNYAREGGHDWDENDKEGHNNSDEHFARIDLLRDDPVFRSNPVLWVGSESSAASLRRILAKNGLDMIPVKVDLSRRIAIRDVSLENEDQAGEVTAPVASGTSDASMTGLSDRDLPRIVQMEIVRQDLLKNQAMFREFARQLQDAVAKLRAKSPSTKPVTDLDVYVVMPGLFATIEGLGWIAERDGKSLLEVAKAVIDGEMAPADMRLMSRMAHATWLSTQFRPAVDEKTGEVTMDTARFSRPVVMTAQELEAAEELKDFEQIQGSAQVIYDLIEKVAQATLDNPEVRDLRARVEGLIDFIKTKTPLEPGDEDRLRRTALTVFFAHRNQTRAQGEAYANHQPGVVELAFDIYGDTEPFQKMAALLGTGGLLHDTREDQADFYRMFRSFARNVLKQDATAEGKERLEKFNAVLLIVRALSKIMADEKHQGTDEELLEIYYKIMVDLKSEYKPFPGAEEAYYNDALIRGIQIIKLCDVLYNFGDLRGLFDAVGQVIGGKVLTEEEAEAKARKAVDKIFKHVFPILVMQSRHLTREDVARFFDRFQKTLDDYQGLEGERYVHLQRIAADAQDRFAVARKAYEAKPAAEKADASMTTEAADKRLIESIAGVKSGSVRKMLVKAVQRINPAGSQEGTMVSPEADVYQSLKEQITTALISGGYTSDQARQHLEAIILVMGQMIHPLLAFKYAIIAVHELLYRNGREEDRDEKRRAVDHIANAALKFFKEQLPQILSAEDVKIINAGSTARNTFLEESDMDFHVSVSAEVLARVPDALRARPFPQAETVDGVTIKFETNSQDLSRHPKATFILSWQEGDKKTEVPLEVVFKEASEPSYPEAVDAQIKYLQAQGHDIDLLTYEIRRLKRHFRTLRIYKEIGAVVIEQIVIQSRGMSEQGMPLGMGNLESAMEFLKNRSAKDIQAVINKGLGEKFNFPIDSNALNQLIQSARTAVVVNKELNSGQGRKLREQLKQAELMEPDKLMEFVKTELSGHYLTHVPGFFRGHAQAVIDILNEGALLTGLAAQEKEVVTDNFLWTNLNKLYTDSDVALVFPAEFFYEFAVPKEVPGPTDDSRSDVRRFETTKGDGRFNINSMGGILFVSSALFNEDERIRNKIADQERYIKEHRSQDPSIPRIVVLEVSTEKPLDVAIREYFTSKGVAFSHDNKIKISGSLVARDSDAYMNAAPWTGKSEEGLSSESALKALDRQGKVTPEISRALATILRQSPLDPLANTMLGALAPGFLEEHSPEEETLKVSILALSKNVFEQKETSGGLSLSYLPDFDNESQKAIADKLEELLGNRPNNPEENFHYIGELALLLIRMDESFNTEFKDVGISFYVQDADGESKGKIYERDEFYEKLMSSGLAEVKKNIQRITEALPSNVQKLPWVRQRVESISEKFNGLLLNLEKQFLTGGARKESERPDSLNFDAAQDKAALVNPGGIDLNAANLDLQIKRDGAGIMLPMSQQNLDNIKIDGLVPVILNIQPAINLPMFSALASESGDGSV